MNIGSAIVEALESLASNKMRSALTILGIVIGVAAVIAMLAIGNGAQNAITGSISGLGSNLLFVYPGNMQGDFRNTKPLTMGDVDALNDPLQAPNITEAAGEVQGQLEAVFAGERTRVMVAGVTTSYMNIRNMTIMDGEGFSPSHLLGNASVAVIGPDTAQKLFSRKDGVVGMTIRIDGKPFRVIGILEAKGFSAMGNQDDIILVPFTTAVSRLITRPSNYVDAIYVSAVSADQVEQASEDISQVLRTRHRTAIGEDDFTVFSQKDIVASAQSVTGVLTLFLGGIAAISLLVGGIGIMNIMLVSVTERTREIGLRKALGARRRDILIQFLTESSLLSMIGGILGIGLGWLIAFAVGKIAAASNTVLIPEVGLDAVLMATLFSTAVGLFFGIYPANRAAGLQPVEALRHE